MDEFERDFQKLRADMRKVRTKVGERQTVIDAIHEGDPKNIVSICKSSSS